MQLPVANEQNRICPCALARVAYPMHVFWKPDHVVADRDYHPRRNRRTPLVNRVGEQGRASVRAEHTAIQINVLGKLRVPRA